MRWLHFWRWRLLKEIAKCVLIGFMLGLVLILGVFILLITLSDAVTQLVNS